MYNKYYCPTIVLKITSATSYPKHFVLFFWCKLPTSFLINRLHDGFPVKLLDVPHHEHIPVLGIGTTSSRPHGTVTINVLFAGNKLPEQLQQPCQLLPIVPVHVRFQHRLLMVPFHHDSHRGLATCLLQYFNEFCALLILALVWQ